MTKTRDIEVIDITANGFWLRVFSKKYYVSFVSKHPYFLGVSAKEIKKVKITHHHTFHTIEWKSLDISLDLDCFEHPRRYPCLMLTKEQLERIQNVLKHPEFYPDIKFTKRQREYLQRRIDMIAEHRKQS